VPFEGLGLVPDPELMSTRGSGDGSGDVSSGSGAMCTRRRGDGPADGCGDGHADVSTRGSGVRSGDGLAEGIPATRHLKTATFTKLKDVNSLDVYVNVPEATLFFVNE